MKKIKKLKSNVKILQPLVLFLIFVFSCSKNELLDENILSRNSSLTIAGNTYYIQNVNSDLYLDVVHSSTSTGANVLQNTFNSGESQQWKAITTNINSTVYLQNVKSGKVLDVSSASTENGANVFQWTSSSSIQQQWIFENRGEDQYSIINNNSKKALDVVSKSTEIGANVQQWVYWAGDNQKWRLIPVGIENCNLDLNALNNNDTVVIDCIYDLNGETIMLPSNVTIEYGEGGSLTNGTLVGNNLNIDGRLLNSTLTIDGTGSLIDPVFLFNKDKWDIVEGTVSQSVALNNRNHLNAIIELIAELNGSTFSIDALDAFFDVSGATILNPKLFADFSIRIPSNLHFKMGDQTFLRVQPSNGWSDQLLYSGGTANIKISGGNLIGDRLAHDYSPVTDDLGVYRGQHEYGSLIYFGGVEGAIIDGVTMKDHPGDCILIQSSAIRNADGSPYDSETYTKDIQIINCYLSGGRRNNISLTDCNNVLIENNVIKNAGLETPQNPQANGTEPRASIDMEAYREISVDDNGYRTLLEYEIVTNIMIRNNEFTGNYYGLNFYTVSHATAENNTFDDGFSSVQARDCVVRNNTFIKGPNFAPPVDRAGFFKTSIRNGIHQATNNEVSNNYFEGYRNGIIINGENSKIFNNTFINCLSAIFPGGKDNEYYNNTINSNLPYSSGYVSFASSTSQNVLVRDSEVNVMYRNVDLRNVNSEELSDDYRLTFDNITFTPNKSFYLFNSNNITVRNSTNVTLQEDGLNQNIILENNN